MYRLTGKVPVSLTSVRLNLRLRKLAELNTIAAVNLPNDRVDLILDRHVEIIQELEARLALARSDEGLRELDGAGSTFGPVVADDGGICTSRQGLLADELELGFGIGSTSKQFKKLAR